MATPNSMSRMYANPEKILKTEYCPIFRTDLRVDYAKEILKSYDKTENDLRHSIKTKRQKQKTGRKSRRFVKWFAKIEYHT